MKNRLATLVGALALSAAASAQTWIWYPVIMKYGWATR